MPTRVLSTCLRGVEAEIIRAEIQIVNGLPGMSFIGLPDSAVKESKDRIKAAIKNSGFPYPDRKILINLAPAHQRKEGTALDLAIAIGILAEQSVILQTQLDQSVFVGELSLDGDLRPVRGMLASGCEAQRAGQTRFFVPEEAVDCATWLERVHCIALPNLKTVVDHLLHTPGTTKSRMAAAPMPVPVRDELDLKEVRGQEMAKKALVVAAAGGHNLILVGTPGTGKTMLAKRFAFLMPDLSREEARDVLRIQGISRHHVPTSYPERPFRSPHHTISLAGLVGGGPQLRVGEITLAHRGVLFLDELAEFHRDHLEALRQPLEEGRIEIGRARYQSQLPADFLLFAAMNPCPCGYLGHPSKPCRCSPLQVQRYRNKISGPLLDRIDLQLELLPPDCLEQPASPGLDNKDARTLIQSARKIQESRFQNQPFATNAKVPSNRLKQFCPLDPKLLVFFQKAIASLSLSQRSHDRCLRVARTIADLRSSHLIEKRDLLEALSYRLLDRPIESALMS